MMIAQALTTAALSTFEELCFIAPSEELTETQTAAAPATDVEVAFSGPRNGRLLVRLYGNVLPELAANMLGSEALPDARLQRDAAGELANVICGNVLPAVMGATRVFRLSAPQVRHATETVTAGDAIVLGLEGGRVEVRLQFDADQ